MSLRAGLCLLSLPLLLAGCRRTEDRNLVVAAPTAVPASTGASRPGMDAAIRLSGAVTARWTGMKIGVIDLQARKETAYVVSSGQDFTVPGSGLTVRVLALVPDFTLDNGVITSHSDEPANPAAKVLITEGGRQLYRGWLFARFPESHAFEHPRFTVRLLELEPARAR